MSINKTLLLTAVIVSVFILATIGALIGCNSSRNPAENDENTASTCFDGIDNDSDGFVDCDDWDCEEFCSEDTLENCFDGIDNDNDEFVDCDDWDCEEFCSEDTAENCSDGIDNDDDGYVDCDDWDCDGIGSCP